MHSEMGLMLGRGTRRDQPWSVVGIGVMPDGANPGDPSTEGELGDDGAKQTPSSASSPPAFQPFLMARAGLEPARDGL
jgi:hypothetical protein